MSVTDIDENYHDFVRPVRASDAGARTHLRGGYGVLGSAVTLVSRVLDVQ